MLRPGGVARRRPARIHVGEGDFLETVRSAALDAHRAVRLIDKRGQCRDHPILLNVPETSYLKCLILGVSN